MKSMKNIKEIAKIKIWGQIRDETWEQVHHHVLDKTWQEVRSPTETQFTVQITQRIREQTRQQIYGKH
jgi:hypothetical protein